MKVSTIFASFATAITLIGSPASAEEAQIAIAANFTAAARELAADFEADTKHKVVISYGSTGKLYAQIEHGAPFHVFLAADERRPALLEKQGGAVSGSRFTYAIGKIVLWSPEPGYVDSEGKVLQSGDFKRLAIANPKTAPYGAAAEQAMQGIGVLNKVRSRLIRGDSIAQTFQFVATNNAPLGFVAMAQVKALPVEEQGSSWEVPQRLYDPIEQQAVLLDKGKDNAAAKAFLAYLQSEKGKAVIQQYGYGTPGSVNTNYKSALEPGGTGPFSPGTALHFAYVQ